MEVLQNRLYNAFVILVTIIFLVDNFQFSVIRCFIFAENEYCELDRQTYWFGYDDFIFSDKDTKMFQNNNNVADMNKITLHHSYGHHKRYSTQHIDRLQKNEKLFHKDELATLNKPFYHERDDLGSKRKLPYPVHFVTFSDENMKNTRERLVRQARRSGWFESVVGYSTMDLPDSFQEEFKKILQLKRGAGYWIWRFPILEMMLDRISYGEYFVFLDAGFTLNRKGKSMLIQWLHELHNSTQYDEMGFQIPELEHQYTTSRTFRAFGVSENNKNIRNSGQIQGGVLIIRNGPHIRKILSAIYQVLVFDPNLITDKYNEEAYRLDSDFRDNRHDQSLHSLTQKIHGSIVKTWICDDSNPFRNYYLRQMTYDEVIQWEQKDISDKTPW